MPEVFDPRKILEISLRIKESSLTLYAVLEEKTVNSELKNIWNHLKEDNQIHCKVFREICQDPERYIVYDLALGEYNNYLREVGPSLDYTKETIDKKIKELFESDLESVEFAIYLTIESILTHSTLKDYIVPLRLDLFNKIIGDERKHLAKLNLAKRKLMV